ncbi:hypothetical protein CKO24_03615 [Rhodothalassium salexigens DSM 2132]|nr:hypothetical protein [Rhodothalassium salexigens DSM 2132]
MVPAAPGATIGRVDSQAPRRRNDGFAFPFRCVTLAWRKMMSDQSPRGPLARLKALWARPTVRLGTVLFIGGAALGLVGAGGTATMVQHTNKTEFCVACHVYDDFYEEYKGSVHHTNATGNRAECADCHIPHDNWINMMVHKARSGLKDAAAYTVGGINTPEEFEERRAVLAKEVWARYERENSMRCRRCHETEAWDLTAQSQAAQGAHQAVLSGNATCIDCHKGIAHSIPEGALAAYQDAAGEPVSAQLASARLAMSDKTEPGAAPQANDADPAAPAPDGAKLFESCTSCHGKFAPGPKTMAALSPEAFMSRIETHMNTGGTVASLSEAEIKAIHEYLKSL